MLTSEFDLDIDTGRKVELHERVHRLRCRVDNIENPAMGTDLKLFARFLVDVRRAQHVNFSIVVGKGIGPRTWRRSAWPC